MTDLEALVVGAYDLADESQAGEARQRRGSLLVRVLMPHVRLDVRQPGDLDHERPEGVLRSWNTIGSACSRRWFSPASMAA
jgi:hypothetical protein